MSENVKIRIIEDNATQGVSTTDSTDIAFIPGFSSNPAAVTGVPVLCKTVEEFENKFGKSPYMFTATAEKGQIRPGAVDTSYIYAKELLRQGMPVVYGALEQKRSETNVELDSVTKSGTPDDDYTLTVSADKKYVNLVNSTSTNLSKSITFTTTFDITATKAATTYFNYVLEADPDYLQVTEVKPQVDNSVADVEATILSASQIKLVNSNTSTGKPVQVSVEIKGTLTLAPNRSTKIKVYPITGPDSLYTNYASSSFKKLLDLVADKGEINVKYITSGGFPSLTLAVGKYDTNFTSNMLSCAASRGDAIALIDPEFSSTLTVFGSNASEDSVYSRAYNVLKSDNNLSFGAMMYPWGEYTTTEFGVVTMPPSFGYLMCVAKAIKTSPNWLAMAGVSRGLVPNLKRLCVPNNHLSNTVAEELQPKYGSENHQMSINCITDIAPYGLTLWGNRTLKLLEIGKGTDAQHFLNTRNMISDIKKLLYTAAKSLMFEQNSDALWLRFKTAISPLLNQLKNGNAISDFKIIKSTRNADGNPLTKGELAAVIKIYPLYAVEFFELVVQMRDDDVVVS